jgi:hypothetical protein
VRRGVSWSSDLTQSSWAVVWSAADRRLVPTRITAAWLSCDVHAGTCECARLLKVDVDASASMPNVTRRRGTDEMALVVTAMDAEHPMARCAGAY